MYIHCMGRYNDKLTPELMTLVGNAGYNARGQKCEWINGDTHGKYPVRTKFTHWIGYSMYHRKFYEYLMGEYKKSLESRRDAHAKAKTLFAAYEEARKNGDLNAKAKAFQRYEGSIARSYPLWYVWGTYWRHRMVR